MGDTPTDTEKTHGRPAHSPGRPALPPGERLDRSVTIQVRADVWDAWRAAATREGLSLAAWVRGRVGVEAHESNGNASPASATRTARGRGRNAVDPELARQVAALGNNLNQVARQINALALAGFVKDSIAAAALDEIVDIGEDLKVLAVIARRGSLGADRDAGESDEAD